MTDRDRLIELLENFTPYKDPIQQMADRMIIEKIADYLLANWVIVPPCKVGDILFCIFSDKSIDKVYTHIEACRVTDIKYFTNDCFVFGVQEINKHYCHNVELGKNAFKTFEEAEEKLKELSK